jgi:hypothetical protein
MVLSSPGHSNSGTIGHDGLDLPTAFREQAFNIIAAAFGVSIEAQVFSNRRHRVEHPVWRELRATVRHELGLESLSDCHEFLREAPARHALVLIAEAFGWIDGRYRGREFYAHFQNCMDPDAAIEDLNRRFAQHGLPFRWTDGRLQRIDSAYLNAQVTEPAVHLLRTAGFEGAEAEFVAAHRSYLGDDHKAAIEHATKAIESTLKAIFDRRSWIYGPKDGASTLIGLAMNYGLVPEYLREHFTGISKVLIGAPTIRNRERGVGHGQGATIATVPTHITAYALHSAAAAIVFLIQSHQATVIKGSEQST